MKKSLLTGINALIALLLTLLGFGSCERRGKYGPPEPMPEYGIPYASFETAGKVTDEDVGSADVFGTDIADAYEGDSVRVPFVL